MSKNRKIKPEEKIRIVQECIDGKISQAQAAEEAGVKKESVRTWIAKYHSDKRVQKLLRKKALKPNRIYRSYQGILTVPFQMLTVFVLLGSQGIPIISTKLN